MLTNLEGENVVIPELVAIAWNLCEAEASDTAGSCLGSVNPDLEKQDKYQNDLAHEVNLRIKVWCTCSCGLDESSSSVVSSGSLQLKKSVYLPNKTEEFVLIQCRRGILARGFL